ncbi:hypothetical protein [Streptomyces sp. NPDC002057]|uniref:hypothetical protein n=1 Tax=Streptomyces sp. NPDC002057 TaxID=3154664 RepID=UPI00332ECED6
MNEWGIALIAAGAAILGSAVTGFFAWKAGHRQAAAAETAGQAQANALISTVQATLDEQRKVRAAEQRRQTYAAMLAAATEWETGPQNHDPELATATQQAHALLRLEGPPEVAGAAERYMAAVWRTRIQPEAGEVDELPGGAFANLLSTRNAFIHAAQDAIENA